MFLIQATVTQLWRDGVRYYYFHVYVCVCNISSHLRPNNILIDLFSITLDAIIKYNDGFISRS